MDKIDSLIEEHAMLRRLTIEIANAVRPQTGIGWDDRVDCDMEVLRAAQEQFQEKLKAHEINEERMIGGQDKGLQSEIQRSHVSLDVIKGMLQTVTRVCDGTHVYAVRDMAERLREDVESHLVYEEKVLFPLLRKREVATRTGL